MGVEKKNGVKKRSANAQNRLHEYDKGFYNVERIFLSIEKNIFAQKSFHFGRFFLHFNIFTTHS